MSNEEVVVLTRRNEDMNTRHKGGVGDRKSYRTETSQQEVAEQVRKGKSAVHLSR